MKLPGIKRLLVAAVIMPLMGLLASCGGGGAGGQGWDGGDLGGSTSAASVKMTTSVPSVGSDGKTVATITAYVADGNNRAMANQLVDFRTADTGVILQPSVSPTLTDESGSVSVKLQVVDPANREVTVFATSSSATSSLTLSVVGTLISLDGPGALISNVPAEFTVAVRDSAGGLVAGKSLKLTSATGNALSSSTVTTDATGRAKFTVTGIVAGADTITVSGLGVSAAAQVVVSSASIAFVSPADAQEIAVATPQAVQVLVTNQGVPQAGVQVSFLTTRGSITASALTDASGRAAASLSSSSAGPATITAQVDSLMSSRRIAFVSTTPSKLNLQASPANVGVNLSSATSNSSQLIAMVRDASDNPVKGGTVSFSADADASGGRIEPATAVTDASGVASAAFYPGPNSTGNNQIVLRASVVKSLASDPSISDTTTLTASRQELFVRVGTGNELAVDNVSYLMPWDAVVTDASGNPVANAVVQVSLVGVGFYKGRYYPGVENYYPGGETDSDPKFWCPSEDANANLRLDAGEDRNGDGQLTPGNVATAYVESAGGQTDQTGFAKIQVKYPKGYGSWTQVRMTVTITTIAGTEGTAVRTFDLPVLVDDVKLDAQPPGGINSAFGVSADCSSIQ